jgi:hypothetical protein
VIVAFYATDEDRFPKDEPFSIPTEVGIKARQQRAAFNRRGDATAKLRPRADVFDEIAAFLVAGRKFAQAAIEDTLDAIRREISRELRE